MKTKRNMLLISLGLLLCGSLFFVACNVLEHDGSIPTTPGDAVSLANQWGMPSESAGVQVYVGLGQSF